MWLLIIIFSLYALNVLCDGMRDGKQEGAARKEKALESACIAIQGQLLLVPMAGVEPAWKLSAAF
ncbi:MAG TPA: hypothetical protein DER33_07860 [Syntrophomonas sp.]|nr:hypothetical protein [Syntrophomonas sp.]